MFYKQTWIFVFRGVSSIRCWQWRLYNEVFQNLFNMILLDFIFSLSKKTLLKCKMQGWDVQYCGCHLSDGGKWKSIKPDDFWFRGQTFLKFFFTFVSSKEWKDWWWVQGQVSTDGDDASPETRVAKIFDQMDKNNVSKSFCLFLLIKSKYLPLFWWTS